MHVSGRTAVIIAAASALAGFLGGFVPQWQRTERVEADLLQTRSALEAARGQLDGATGSVRLAGLLGHALALRDMIAAQNYGLAQQQATRFFDAVSEESARASQGTLAAGALGAVLETRDRVIAGLSTADPAVARIARENEARLRGALGFAVPEIPEPVVPAPPR